MDSKKPNGAQAAKRATAGRAAAKGSRRRAEMARKRRQRKRVLAGMTIMFLSAAVILGGVLIHMYNQEQREVEVQRKLQEVYMAAAEAAQMPTMDPDRTSEAASSETGRSDDGASQTTNEPAAENTPTAAPSGERRISAQLEALYDINPDLIGWVEMGDMVSVPVVFRDNDYYMARDFYGNSSVSGTVFADEENVNWQEDPYLLLYGHNMRENIMFGKLDQLKNIEDFKRNTLVQFQTLYDDEVRYYVPFAAVDASVKKGESSYFWLRRFELFHGETRDEQKIAEFIEEIRARSFVEVPSLEVTAEDDILCLVTCSYSSEEGRLMVFCRRVREGEDAADMSGYVSETARLR